MHTINRSAICADHITLLDDTCSTNEENDKCICFNRVLRRKVIAWETDTSQIDNIKTDLKINVRMSAVHSCLWPGTLS
jgi:hypothetical protein